MASEVNERDGCMVDHGPVKKGIEDLEKGIRSNQQWGNIHSTCDNFKIRANEKSCSKRNRRAFSDGARNVKLRHVRWLLGEQVA